MAISQVHCADDLAALARETVQQVRVTKQYRDLIAAVLMASHVADWHYLKGLGHKKFAATERLEMANHYPEWDVLRKLANGMKHCKLQSQQDSLEWEHSDFWSSPGHVGADGFD